MRTVRLQLCQYFKFYCKKSRDFEKTRHSNVQKVPCEKANYLHASARKDLQDCNIEHNIVTILKDRLPPGGYHKTQSDFGLLRSLPVSYSMRCSFSINESKSSLIR